MIKTISRTREEIITLLDLARTEGQLPSFKGQDLSRMNLSKLDLSRIDLSECNLTEADLAYSDLSFTNLSQAKLNNASLQFANLKGANLSRAELSGADLTTALFGKTILGDVDLSNVNGLDNVFHSEPSTIGIDTIYNSEGKIPEQFLRGIGVSDQLINLIGSLTFEPIKYYSVFISYSAKDKEFVSRLHHDLQEQGVRTWYAPEDIKVGERFHLSIDRAIRVHDKLLVVLSQHSLPSQWIEAEVETALNKEAERGYAVLFPIRIDNAVMDINIPWVVQLRRTRHIADFSNWKAPDSYNQAIKRLLRDLHEDPKAQRFQEEIANSYIEALSQSLSLKQKREVINER